jgi:cytochrome c556
MIRSVCAVAVVILGVSVAIAQQDAIKERKALMKANGDQAKIGADMIKGAEPFDLDKAHKIFATFENAAQKMPVLFPEGSKPRPTSTDQFDASPKVWAKMADVKARFAKFGDDAKAAEASVKDLESFKSAFGNIGKNDCGGCHEQYRVKKS